MTVSRSSSAICLLALVLAPWLTIERSRAQTQPGPYAVTDLGPVGTVTAQANDINDAGQAVGSFSAPGTTGPRAFVWQDGLLTVLSDLHSGAGGISPNGLIVGTAKIPPSTFFEGAIFENGGVTPLGFQGTTGAAINDHRQVVGTINHAMPFFWDNGVLTELGTFGGPCGGAADINNLGQVVGHACTSTGTELGPSTHAFLWQGGAMTEIEPFPGHVDSGATAINSLGQVAGWSSITDPEDLRRASDVVHLRERREAGAAHRQYGTLRLRHQRSRSRRRNDAGRWLLQQVLRLHLQGRRRDEPEHRAVTRFRTAYPVCKRD